MDQQVVQNRLEDLYANWKTTLRIDGEEAGNLSPPLLLYVSETYCRAKRRILLFGQETCGWEWNRNLQVVLSRLSEMVAAFHDIYS